MKTIAIGSDHAGYLMKERLKKELANAYEFVDMGTTSEEAADYPLFAKKVGEFVQKNPDSMGALLCGNGIGIAMAANKMKGIRAALAYSKEVAAQTRQHNHANVVVVAGRAKMMDDPVEIVKTFLKTEESQEERHIRRVGQIMEMEESS